MSLAGDAAQAPRAASRSLWIAVAAAGDDRSICSVVDRRGLVERKGERCRGDSAHDDRAVVG
jgi:hypothetical protein